MQKRCKSYVREPCIGRLYRMGMKSPKHYRQLPLDLGFFTGNQVMRVFL
ncbi:MAG: hypothetical protein ACI9TH_003901 [Kiritimatiellia bacterium]|jgi:hypothetical protein